MKQTITLYVAKYFSGFLKGELVVSNRDPSQFSSDIELIATQEAEIEVPEVDVNEIMIQKLHGQIRAVRVKADDDVARLQVRLQEMLSATQEAGE